MIELKRTIAIYEFTEPFCPTGFLYCWLIVPTKGIVAFHEANISDVDLTSGAGEATLLNEGVGVASDASFTTSTSLLDQYIQGIRDALGVELQASGTRADVGTGGDSELGDLWSQHLEELGDKLNQEGDRSGFLRMVNRSHAFNSSSYSLSSLFSLGSVSINSGSTSRPGSTRSRRSLWQGPACLRSLYDLLLAPIEVRCGAFISTKNFLIGYGNLSYEN